MTDPFIYHNKKVMITMLALILVIALVIDVLFYVNTESNKKYSLNYGIQITSHVNTSYTVYLPFPIEFQDTPMFNTSDITELIGDVYNISFEETVHGMALSVNATGSIFIGFSRNVSPEIWKNSSNSGLSMWEEYKDDSRKYIAGKVWIYGSGFDTGDIYINLIYYHKSSTEDKSIEDNVIETIIPDWSTYEVARSPPPMKLGIK